MPRCSVLRHQVLDLVHRLHTVGLQGLRLGLAVPKQALSFGEAGLQGQPLLLKRLGAGKVLGVLVRQAGQLVVLHF